MKESVAQCRFFLTVFAEAVAGLDDSHRAVLPNDGAKTAGWILGHLAVTGDFARKLCGRPPVCPKDWRARYSPGTTPSTDSAEYPPMAELIGKVREIYADLCDAALQVDPATLDIPTPFVPRDRPTRPLATLCRTCWPGTSRITPANWWAGARPPGSDASGTWLPWSDGEGRGMRTGGRVIPD
ncbi:MAG TPA: DinB family protein [Gemmatimonadaceae bacterium]